MQCYVLTAYGESCRNWNPYRSKIKLEREFNTTEYNAVAETYGSGAIKVDSPANRAVAPTNPSRLYIAGAARGNTAPNTDRVKLLLASADAAIGRKARTM
jgi:hypothetical protein